MCLRQIGMNGVSRILTGDGEQVFNTSSNVIKIVDKDMLNRSGLMGYRETTTYRSIGGTCYSRI